ncbi:MAG: hypothetical protein ACI976_000296 [Aureispira sp.]|jgi:hypothetical protein
MPYIISCFLLIFISSCQPKESTKTTEELVQEVDNNTFYTKAYYYPIESLSEEKIYEYVLEKEGETYRSHYLSLKKEFGADSAVYLRSKYYGPDFQQNQEIKEWIIKDGVITQEYTFLVLDSVSQTLKKYTNEVSQNVVFPFYASLDSVMAYRFVCEMKLPPDFLKVKLVRDRKFNKKISYTYKEEALEAIAFVATDLYDIENVEGGGFWEQKKGAIEVYAKGIGLVYKETKTAGAETTEVERLSTIYSVEEFEALKATYK